MRTRFLIIIFLLITNIPVQGQVNNINFRQVSPPGGFTLKSIHIITQDKLGYIWMGTQQGLIRYDSKNTTWFIPEQQNEQSIPSELINDIYVDSENKLWVATNHGLCLFNRKTEDFKQIEYIYDDGTTRSDTVIGVAKDDYDRLLILDLKYFGYYDSANGIFKRIGHQVIKKPSHLYKDHFNRIWIGTENGDVFRYYPATHTIDKIITGNNTRVNAVYAGNEFIWVGFQGEGVKRYNHRGGLMESIAFSTQKLGNYKGTVRSIKRDTYGRMWFGAYEGLFMNDGSKLSRFNPDNYPGLPHNSIYEIFEDAQGAIWIGTWSGGVALFHHSDNNFSTFRHSTTHNSISDNKISSFLQVSNDKMLIGTEVGGLNSFNLNTRRFSTINISPNQKVVNIKSLCQDKFGGIWVGTFQQNLWYKPANSQQYIEIKSGPEDGRHISSNSVYSLSPVDSGVWIATFPEGLNFYSFKSKSIAFFKNKVKNNITDWDIEINCIYADSKSNLWVGTLKGLFKIHLPSKSVKKVIELKQFLKTDNYTIFEIWEDKAGKIWIGTKNNGTFIYNPANNSFNIFNADGLLSGKDVYGVIEDQNDNLWISSNNGLIMHNPKLQTNRHFVYSDGIQSNLFSPRAIYKDQQNSIYFGGTNGFTMINPKQISTNLRKPKTVINRVSTKDNVIFYPQYNDNLEIEKLILKAGENTFRVSFSAENYLLPQKNRYKYRLVNYYDDWIESRNEGSILFTGLEAGDYIFEVKASNNDGIWNETPTRMEIKINTFWYQTNLAYFVYLIFFVTVVYLIGRFYFERIKLRRAVELEKSQRENEEMIHEIKLKFFTNISHEFRTPLALISWPLKKLLQADNISPEQRSELEIVERNSNRLLQLINQLIDFRKLDKHKARLNIIRFDLIPFILDIQKGFILEGKSKNIEFILDSQLKTCHIEADMEKVDMVIYNLFSNAYKYCSNNGQIKLSIDNKRRIDTTQYTNQLSFGKIEEEDFVEIAVEDTGQGINSEDLLKIFNRFEQGAKKEKNIQGIKGSGIGLSICKDFTLLHNGEIMAQSTEGKGSVFTIRLPKKQKAHKIMFESHLEFKNLKNNEIKSVLLKNEKEPDKLSQILVVEDNVDFRNLVSNFLGKYYQVETASNGEEAINILKSRVFDLVVSDVMMPKMDGFEFCRIVKTEIETSHIPVVLFTALSSSENFIAGLDSGADAFLRKPFDENILLRQIENILEQRRRIRENFNKQFLSQKTVQVGSLDNFFLNRVKTVVEDNLTEESFDMEVLAEELRISRSWLHRKIKSLSGLTTSDFVNLIRVKKAAEMIESGQYLFNEVAYQVGFSSQSYFNKCFKKVYGVTPKEYLADLDNKSGK